MPFFLVQCRNTHQQNHKNFLQTPYYTDFQTEAEIKIQMERSEPIKITCLECGLTEIYTYRDFLILRTE